MTRNLISSDFLSRPSYEAAPKLLGKYLVRKYHGEEYASYITEVEAYDGENDAASHAYRGVTPRTKVMFGPPGFWYVYFIYGMHHMINIVTGEDGQASAVLLRGTHDVSGPGRLTKYFHIDKSLYGLPASLETGLWIEDRGLEVVKEKIVRTSRVGIDSVPSPWKEKPYRFVYDEKKVV